MARLYKLLRLDEGGAGRLAGYSQSSAVRGCLLGRGGEYLGNLAAGRDLLLLVDPCAFGAARAKYALATAGEGYEPGVEMEQE